MLGYRSKSEFALLWIARVILLFMIFLEFQANRTPILFINIIVFLLTFAPGFARRVLSIDFPALFELIYLCSLLATVILEKLFMGVLVQVILGVFFGIFGFLLMYTLYYNNRIEMSYKLIVFSSFSFAVTVGALWEVFRYLLQAFVGVKIGYPSFEYASLGLIFTVIGAGVISVIEYFYLRFGESRGLSWLASTFASKNPELFVDEEENSPEFVQELIESGEGEKLEFKSTLRVNLHTGERDEDVEHAVLKTITAFLNTDGGTLLIGVSDDGEVTGIQKDEFGDNDKFYRHYSNLVRHHIDNKYLSLIQSNLIQMDGKHILKVDCRSSNEGVFLKVGDEQEFYVRTGPASVQLKGKKLVDYINQKYK